jgi:pyridinium-3,5-bisthiocarboxylic acid mononucleotide nickel chelatase
VFLLFDMQTGVSGDMILGSLFDLGLDFKEWKKRIATLGLPEMKLEISKVMKNGISATSFQSHFPHEHHHRGLKEIHAIVESSRLSAWVKETAQQVFTRLAQVEAKIHGVELDQVHFHEVGALDAIVDIVGACLGFEMLGVEKFFTTPFTFGTGAVKTQHGILSEPVPATLALSEGFASVRTQYPGELCTPTGTALITTLAQPLPADLVVIHRKQGYGAGSRDLPEISNVLRICLMEPRPNTNSNAFFPALGSGANPASDIYQVECNLDNMSAELIGYVAEKLLAAGCKDVWQEPIFMKKNRAGTKLCALVHGNQLEAILSFIASETETGGLRYYPVHRLVAEKSQATVALPFGNVTLKGVRFAGMASPRYTPEYESCRKWAETTGLSLPDIYRQTLIAAQDLSFSKPENDILKSRLEL